MEEAQPLVMRAINNLYWCEDERAAMMAEGRNQET
jgi:hypothetical protein